MMLALVAAQEAPSGSPQDQPINPESLRPGEIIIRRTGKVRLVKVAPAPQRAAAATTQPTASAQPGAAVRGPAAQAAAKAQADEGLEYGEHSVRLPLGYDPADNYSPYGPVLNLPLESVGYPEPYYGGIIGGGCDLGFRGIYGGGYGYGRNYGYGFGSNCPPALGFGGGRGSWDYGFGRGYHSSAGVSRTTGVWIPSGGGGTAHSPSRSHTGRRH